MSETDNPARSDRGGLFSRIGSALVPLLSGSGAGQLLLFAVYPVISRLYTTEDFGLLAVFTAISMPLTVIASLKYEFALPGARSESEAVALAAACAAITLFITIISLSLLNIAFVFESFRAILAGNYLFLLFIALAIFFGGTMRWLNYWYVRHRNFKVIGVGNVTHASAMALTQVSCGALLAGPWGLLLSQFIAPACAIVLMLLRAGSWPFKFAYASASKLKEAVNRYRMYSVYGAPYAFVHAMCQYVPGFILAGLLGLGPAGLFLMAQRILKHPADLTGEALRQAIFPELVQAAENGKLTNAMLRITAAQTIAMLPALIVITIFGPELFSVILGDQWRESGMLAAYLIFYVGAGFASVPASVVIQIIELQRFHLLMEILLLVLVSIAITLGAITAGLAVAVFLSSLVGVAVNVALLVVTAEYARRQDRRIARHETPAG